MPAFIVSVLIGAFLLLCFSCGYAAYWVTGGVVEIEVWRTLAVMWGITIPCIGMVALGIYFDAA